MTPESPLPWTSYECIVPGFWCVEGQTLCIHEQDAKYIAHACNAYPKLIQCLKKIAEHYGEFSAGWDAEDLLKELGEL